MFDLDQRRLMDAEITRLTVDFMQRSVASGKPFYAYVPFTLVHFPTLPHPKVFDLITDPKEEYPVTGLRNTWNAEPLLKIVEEFQESLRTYPPIAPGTPDPYTPPQ